MKNNLVKRIAVLAAVAVMGMSMAACGNKAEEAATETPAEETEAPAEEAQAPVEEEAPVEEATLTEEEYIAKAQAASDNLITTMTNVETDLAAMDLTDLNAVTEYVEGLKAPLNEFASLQAPEKFAEVQGKFKESCEALIEYFDLCIEMMNPETEVATEDATAKITELYTSIQTSLTEAYTMMDELTGADAAVEEDAAEATEENAEDVTEEPAE